MLAAFLPPYPFRAQSAPYLWCYYRLLCEWENESALFITGRDYVRPVSDWLGRWECEDDAAKRLDYTLPFDTQPQQHEYLWLDDNIFSSWLELCQGNPLSAFRSFLDGRDSLYESELYELLFTVSDKIEALITFCNIPSLSAVCQKLKIPLIHMELGPLRGHIYRDTSYFDFQGVNGNTEIESRERKFGTWNLPKLYLTDLLHFFITDVKKLPEQTDALGVVLQVEDDSNLVAFGNGMSNQSLILAATQKQKNVLVRTHPGSIFSLRQGKFEIDASLSSLEFVSRCKKIMTINSSVALEALLLGKEVTIFGDSSLLYLSKDSQIDRNFTSRLAFYLFAYLVPRKIQCLPEYIRFRLAYPSEIDIIKYHLHHYMKEDNMIIPKKMEAEDISSQLCSQVWASNKLKQEIAELKEQLFECQKSLNALGESHSYAMSIVEERDKQIKSIQAILDKQNEQLNTIRHHPVLSYYISNFMPNI